jgi:hypothetical protein
MGVRGVLAGLVACAAFAVLPGGAIAEPGSGPRETVDQTFTTTAPGTPTGVDYSATYHAAGDPNGNPPFLRRMVFHPPEGMRFDTSVPEKCTATDAELAVRGPDACPAGSRLGGGTVDGIFYFPFSDNEFHRYHHNTYVLNNTDEQILLVESEGFTVQRGQVHPDGSVEFNPTTCFPASPTGQCADDYILQLKSSSSLPAYTNARGSYATTPATCPESRRWVSTVQLSWSDGSVDDVATTQPCT